MPRSDGPSTAGPPTRGMWGSSRRHLVMVEEEAQEMKRVGSASPEPETTCAAVDRDPQDDERPMLSPPQAAAEAPRDRPREPVWRMMKASDTMWNCILGVAPPQGTPAIRCLLVRDQRWTTQPETRLVLDKVASSTPRGETHCGCVPLSAYDHHVQGHPTERPPLLTAIRQSSVKRWGSTTTLYSIRRGGASGEEIAVVRAADLAKGEEGIASLTLRGVGMAIDDDDPEGELCSVVYQGNPRSRTRPRRTIMLVPGVNRKGERGGWAGGERSRSLQDAWRASTDDIPCFGIHVLYNKEPRWDPVHGCWQLGFGGRAREASARNLIIPAPHAREVDAPPTVLLGRMSRYSWTLDFAYPACALQAFFVALGQFELPD
eukprot:TRINITY_DN35682_c0_g1_i1.p1 TRINITY_DN35682_c0_g1~~TRINITY_DN35682_c0_g1_i1.p1  ORF type:complete len:375 (+),score=50.50 TRINITY_DN35682_c0_g1_i1:58-1182(+)